jgi:hypothetical protein
MTHPAVGHAMVTWRGSAAYRPEEGEMVGTAGIVCVRTTYVTSVIGLSGSPKDRQTTLILYVCSEIEFISTLPAENVTAVVQRRNVVPSVEAYGEATESAQLAVAVTKGA